MSDLYSITVLARDGGVIDLAVDIVHPDVVDIPLSPSFAAMLIEDEWGPGAAAFKAWWRAWADRDPAADPAPLYQSVELIEVRNLPRVQSEPPTGMTWDDVDGNAAADPGRSLLGAGVVRITVSDPGLIAHLDPGMRWSSTAYDEGDTGPIAHGEPGEVRRWQR